MISKILDRLTVNHTTKLDATNLPYPIIPVTNARVVFFDIYGTILLSAEGEIGNTIYSYKRNSKQIEQRFAAACRTACKELFTRELPTEHFEKFHHYYLVAIHATHNTLKKKGVFTPEIEIRDIWHRILTEHQQKLGIDNALLTTERVAMFAIMIELLTNPVQLAPYIGETLAALRQNGFTLGIISNAQFYTPLIVAHLMQTSLPALGFNPALCYWSYEWRIAKPAASCFEQSIANAERLIGATANEMLYIGNDLRNDIIPAAAAGMRTCLYCGDKRSLRLYPNQADINRQRADIWLTDYRQLIALLGKSMDHQQRAVPNGN